MLSKTFKFFVPAVALTTTTFFNASTASAAVDMYLQFDQGGSVVIKGETNATDAKDLNNAVQVLAWSWGTANSGSVRGTGTGAGAGRVNMQDVSCTIFADSTLPSFIKANATGAHIKNAKLRILKSSGGSKNDRVDYINVTLDELVISSVQTGGSGGEERMTVNVALNFSKIKFEVWSFTGQGRNPTPASWGWNLVENKPL